MGSISPAEREKKKRPDRFEEQIGHYSFVLKSLPEDQAAQTPSLINGKLKQNMASIRNRGIMTYLATKRQKKYNEKKDEARSF